MGRKPQEINPECGKRLKEWLDDVGITASALCKAIHYTPQYISDVVRGKKRMTPDLASKIAHAPKHYVDPDTGDTCSLIIPQGKRVLSSWLLCESDIKTATERIEHALDAAEASTKAAHVLIKNAANNSGFDIVYAWDRAPNTITPSDNDVFYNILEDGNVVAGIGLTEYSQLRKEIFDYTAFLVSRLIEKQKQVQTPCTIKEGYNG